MVTRRHWMIGAGAGLTMSLSGRAGRAAAAEAWGEDLAREFATLEAGIGARMGVTVIDTGTGAHASHRGTERFPMCSTFKWLASAAVLTRVDAGRESLERRVHYTASDLVTYSPATEKRVDQGMTMAEICEAAITLSDNTAGNLILASLGGPAGLTAYARSIGDAVSRLDRNEPTLNEAKPGDPRDTTTPDAMAANLQAVVLGARLSAGSRAQLTGWLVANTTGGTRLRAGLPKDWRVGDKTGTGAGGTNNDVAVVWPPGRAPLVICAYSTETQSPPERCNAAIAGAARAIAASLAG